MRERRRTCQKAFDMPKSNGYIRFHMSNRVPKEASDDSERRYG